MSEGTNLAVAEDQSASELAKAAQNPIASLISIPIQSNINFDWGPGGDTFAVTNIQPVLPFRLNDDWNLVTRTILLSIRSLVPIRCNRQARFRIWHEMVGFRLPISVA